MCQEVQLHWIFLFNFWLWDFCPLCLSDYIPSVSSPSVITLSPYHTSEPGLLENTQADDEDWVGGRVGESVSLIDNPCSHMPPLFRQSDQYSTLLFVIVSSSGSVGLTDQLADNTSVHCLMGTKDRPAMQYRHRGLTHPFETAPNSSGREAPFSQDEIHSGRVYYCYGSESMIRCP